MLNSILRNIIPSNFQTLRNYIPSAKTLAIATAVTLVATAAAYYYFGPRDLSPSQPEICQSKSFLGVFNIPFTKACVPLEHLTKLQSTGTNVTAAYESAIAAAAEEAGHIPQMYRIVIPKKYLNSTCEHIYHIIKNNYFTHVYFDTTCGK